MPIQLHYISIRNFQAATEWGATNGVGAAFPTFHQADYGHGIVRGMHALPANSVDWQDVPRHELGGRTLEALPEIFRVVGDRAVRRGYRWALPTFWKGFFAYGVNHFKSGTHMDIPREDLGNVELNNVPAMFRAAADWSGAHNAAGAIPTFHQADYGDGVVYGLIVFAHGELTWRDVLDDELEMGLRFRFRSEISQERRYRLLRNHGQALRSVTACSNLSASQKQDLRAAYRKDIEHRISTKRDANATARVGGNWIAVNFDNLFPDGDTEIAQTLIHEMMHVAGYNHPDWDDKKGWQPGDNGAYYGSPPLQAEICIAGGQSLSSREANRICRISNGEAHMSGWLRPAPRRSLSNALKRVSLFPWR